MNQERILVTAIGGRAGYNFVRCLKESDLSGRLYIIGADMSPDYTKILCDNFVTIPGPKDAHYLHDLGRVVEDFDVGLVVPTSDEECLALSVNHGNLGSIKTTPLGSYEGVLSAKDKLKLYEMTKDLEVVPYTVEIEPGARIRDIKKKISLPVFIKPRMGRGGRFTHMISDGTLGEEEKLEKYWKTYRDDFGPPICQEFIDSNDYGIDTYTDGRGKVNFGAMRKKLKVKRGDRIVGMNAVSVDEPGMEEVSRKIIDALGLKGMVEIEMRRDNDGAFYALDVNPRVGGSIYISKASGRNIATLPILDHLGEPYPEFYYATGIETRRSEMDDAGGKKFYWDTVFPEDPASLKTPLLLEVSQRE